MFRAVVAALALLVSVPAVAAPSLSSYYLVAHGRPVRAGDIVNFEIRPTPPPGVVSSISITTFDGRRHYLTGPYRAPYVIQPGTPPVEVTVTLADANWQRELTTELELTPSRLPGVETCLGDNQAFLPESGDIVGAIGGLQHDMPPVIYKVRGEAPAGGRPFAGKVIVRTLVCRSGMILDAFVTTPPGAAPVDPRVAEAAVAAARRTLFGQGEAAYWVDLPIAFGR